MGVGGWGVGDWEGVSDGGGGLKRIPIFSIKKNSNFFDRTS